MKISVVVPFWNSEKWLDRCCASLNRNKGDFNFILVDDKSTDKGKEVAYRWCFKDPRFMLMVNFKTRGVSGARNTGLEYAIESSDWITFLDADDEMMPDAYEIFEGAIKDDERANIHQFNHVRYYKEIEKESLKYFNYGGSYDVEHPPQMWFGVWNKLYRAEFLKDIRFDESINYGEDGLFILECLSKDNYIHHADKNQTTVRHWFDNKSSLSHIKTSEDILNQIRRYEDFFMRQSDPTIKRYVCNEIALLWNTRMVKSI